MKTLTRIMAVVMLMVSSAVMAQEGIEGTWQGRLNLGPDQTLTVQFIITQEDDGSLSSVINSPDMGGIKNIPASSTEFDGTNLKINVAELSGEYSGALSDGSFEGEWVQGGAGMALSLSPFEKPVMSQAEIDTLLGEWVGKLAIPAGELTLVFRFARNEAGELQGFIRSPDQGGNEAPAQDVLLQDGVFSMKVPAAQVQITGDMTATEFKGKFQQGPQQLDLNMTKGAYEAPVYVLDLPAETEAQLMGEWHGEIETPIGVAVVIYRFETNENGDFVGVRNNVDQGGTDISISEVTLEDGNIKIVNPGPGGTYNGKLDGEEITGQMMSPMGGVTMNLVKGEYVPKTYPLSLSDEEIQVLAGRWAGVLKSPQRDENVVVRIEQGDDSNYYAYVDNETTEDTDGIITEVALDGADVMFKTRFPSLTFNGTLADGEINGSLSIMNTTMELSLTKE